MNRTQAFAPSHLSDAQLYELLDQPEPAQLQTVSSSQSHLAVCVQCRDEFEAVQGSLRKFQQAATGMAQAHFSSNLSFRGRAFERKGRMALPFSFAAVALLCGTTLTLVLHPGAAKQARGVHAASSSQPVESDEALLDGIVQDLTTSVAPSLQPLTVSVDGTETSLTHN